MQPLFPACRSFEVRRVQLHELGDVGDQLPCDHCFWRAREFMHTMFVEQHQFVVVGAERGLGKIGGEQR